MHDDKVHFNLGQGGYKSCMCCCKQCLGFYADCLCKQCSCKDTRFKLHDHDPNGDRPLAMKKVEHPCVDCGKEIVRTHSRGRWPIRCINCRT